jgi:hypothetical protein
MSGAQNCWQAFQLTTFVTKLTYTLKKLIGPLLLISAVVAAFFWFYSSVEEQGGAQNDTLKAIPQDAALLFKTRNTADLWRDLSQSSVIWDELQATDLYFKLNTIGHLLDSTMREQPELRKYFDKRAIAVSVHTSGARSYSFLLAIPLHTGGDEAALKNQLIGLLKPKGSPEIKTYNGITLTTLQPAFNDQPITFYIADGILALSLSSILAEESVRALREGANVYRDAQFMHLSKTVDAYAKGQVYINHKRFSSIVAPYVNGTVGKAAFFGSPYASWSALDLTMKSNALLFNGFIQASDSTDYWLPAFAGLKAPPIKVLDYMPSNTAFFSFYGFGDFTQYKANIAAMREKRGEKYKVDNTFQALDAACGCKSEQLAASWIGNQAATFITEPASGEYTNNKFAVFQCIDKTLTDQSLEALAAAFPVEKERKSEEVFEDHAIYQISSGHLFSTLLGSSFEGFEQPYLVRVDDMVLMANSLNGLRMCLQMQSADKTLAQEKGFADMASQISAEAHFVVFSALSRSPELYKSILNAKEGANIEKQTAVLRKFQGFLYQVNHHKNDLHYNNIYFRHNPVYSQETTAIWEAKLNNGVQGVPHLVQNHYTNALEVLVQDLDHKLYLISNTGKILWEAKLDGPIVGEVIQIDLFKNRKLQMVIGTASKLYVLDRNGNSLDNFPISFPTAALAAVEVVDYDNSRDYRFFVPLTDGQVLAWDGFGKQVEGWSFTDKEAAIVAPVRHIRVRSKDYLFAVNGAGSVHLLDRRGNSRHSVDLKIPKGAMQPYAIEYPDQVISSGAVCVLDSAGVAYRIGFDSRMDMLDLGVKSPKSARFEDIDKDGKPDCIVQVKDGVVAFSMEGKKLMEWQQDGLDAPLQIIKVDGPRVLMAAVSREGHKVYLFDARGTMIEGFPLIGSIAPTMGDINGDGQMHLVTGTAEGYIYGYAVQRSWE